MGMELTTFFRENNFKESKGITYGVYKKRMCTFSTHGAYYKGVFSFSRKPDQGIDKQIDVELNALKTKFKEIQKIFFSPLTVETLYYKSNEVDSAIIASLNEISQILDKHGISQIDECPLCQNELYPDSPKFCVNGIVFQAHDECIRKMEEADINAKKTRSEVLLKDRNRYKGVLGAICGGLLGGVALMLLTYLNFLPILGSFIIYLSTNFLYNKFKGKIDGIRYIIVTLISVLSVTIFYYLGTCFFIYQNNDISLNTSFSAFFTEMKINSDFTKLVLLDYLFMVLFIVIFNFISYKRIKSLISDKSIMRRVE